MSAKKTGKKAAGKAGENLCPDCGGKPESTTQNTATGAEVFQCAQGHSWAAQAGS